MMRELKKEAFAIAREAVAASMPDEAVRRALAELAPAKGKTVAVAVGKAAWPMAQAAARALAGHLDAGYVITKYGHAQGELPGFQVFEAGHPQMDENGVRATRAVLEAVSALAAEDRVLFLLSGGGSALMEAPLLPFAELQDINAQLLACGADIVEVNTIRKRLSAVKGGKFARACAPAEVVSIILSDVVGDRADMIASGPACPDTSTAQEALEIARKYSLRLSEAAWELLRAEPVRELANARAMVTGGVGQLCRAALEECARRGYEAELLTDCLCCEAREAGTFLGCIARAHAGQGRKPRLRRRRRDGGVPPWPRQGRPQSGNGARRRPADRRPQRRGGACPRLGRQPTAPRTPPAAWWTEKAAPCWKRRACASPRSWMKTTPTRV